MVKRDKNGFYSLNEFKGLEGHQLKALVKVAVPQPFAAEPNWNATLRVVDATTGHAVKEWAFDRDHTRYAASKPGRQSPFGPELSDTTRNHFSDLAQDIAGFLQLTTARALPGARVAELHAGVESIEMVDEADSDGDDDEYPVDAPDDPVTATRVGKAQVRPPLPPAVDCHLLDLTLDVVDQEYLDLTLDDANSEANFIDLTLDALEPAPKRARRNFNDGTLRTWLESAGRA
ncbi:hypothetical protein MVLG_06499 [Microbotryum lychnidis-dioicae p1A1 Lamole]|uniref:Uncharacterized protein n=1 Tax=Microbotryum lychnidis-dioicae (strain p1A1 Lamole / MvSl-1064) TaxID=683840 RepID=U5HHG8_USTV1|nr:hypothetical protein MVLG_06499 [Microbotryum lychnidis-dioicae p1A1 Lamole]|eukprot:KDE03000.1 hypothetical protein MVLG_06499 [Microbotryum lychnidis-dioicae p1A1 Lamole]